VSRLCLVDSVGFDDWPTRDVKIAKASLPLTRFLPTTWILGVVRSDLQRGYAEHERGLHSVEQYLRPFSTPEGRDLLVRHLEALDSADTQALAPRLANIVAPTAVAWGAHDPFLTPELGRRLQNAIPGATLDIIPDVRHFTPEEAPERIGDVLTMLLGRQ
jgi:pimeloyl-ACP methyl ester carboxylesterase